MCRGGGGWAEYALVHWRRAIVIGSDDIPWEQAATLQGALQTMHDAIITNVLLRKEYDDPLKIEKKMTKALDMRNLSQPIKDLSCGSTFRNPLGRSSLEDKYDSDHSLKAWKLIDNAGLRGIKLGGAMVSKKHTNFLINTGNATAKDIEDLGNFVIEKVKKNSGIDLTWEVKRVGRY